jgi:hypothetical protein
MTRGTFTHRPQMPQVTGLKLRRLILLSVGSAGLLLGGTVWLLKTQGHSLAVPPIDSAAWPAWMKQSQAYPAPEVKSTAPVPAPVDPLAA